MMLSGPEAKKLALPVLIFVSLSVAGAALIWYVERERQQARRDVAAATKDRGQKQDLLKHIAEEEREVKEKLEIYRQLKQLKILGEERRLEWADAVARIRASRELADLRYRVERQRLLFTVPGKPANVDFYASSMKVELAMLHEGDLLRFLGDLRDSGNAYYSVQRCAIARTGQAPGAQTMAARLRADCSIDLITIIDRAAKS